MLKIIDVYTREQNTVRRKSPGVWRGGDGGEAVRCAGLIIFYHRYYYILILLSPRKFAASRHTRIYGRLIICGTVTRARTCSDRLTAVDRQSPRDWLHGGGCWYNRYFEMGWIDAKPDRVRCRQPFRRKEPIFSHFSKKLQYQDVRDEPQLCKQSFFSCSFIPHLK